MTLTLFCRFRADYRRELIGEDVYQDTLQTLGEMDTHAPTILGWVREFLGAREIT